MVRVRKLTEQEAQRLQRIVRRGGGTQSVVTWRRAMVVLASAQGHSVPVIARMVQTSEDRVREMIRNFDEGGMESLHPRWSEGRPATFTPKVRARIIRTAIQRPEKFGLPFSTWSVAKLRDYLIKRRVVPSISKERLRQILAEEGISFQKTKTWKESPDPDKEAKLARIEQVTRDHPDRVVAFDEFGPLTIEPVRGAAWAPRSKPQRLPANYRKLHGVRHLMATYHFGGDELFGRVVPRKGKKATLHALKEIRARFPDGQPLYVILDNLNHHRSATVTEWTEANAIELCFTPTYASWANPIECHLGAIRYFVLRNSNYTGHRALASRLHAYLRWRNANKRDPKLLKVVRDEQRKVRSERALKTARKAGRGGLSEAREL